MNKSPELFGWIFANCTYYLYINFLQIRSTACSQMIKSRHATSQYTQDCDNTFYNSEWLEHVHVASLLFVLTADNKIYQYHFFWPDAELASKESMKAYVTSRTPTYSYGTTATQLLRWWFKVSICTLRISIGSKLRKISMRGSRENNSIVWKNQ